MTIPHLRYGCTENIHEARNQASGALEAIEESIKEIGQPATAEGLGINAGALSGILVVLKQAVEGLENVNKFFEENQEPEYPPEPTEEDMRKSEEDFNNAMENARQDEEAKRDMLEAQYDQHEREQDRYENEHLNESMEDGQPDFQQEYEGIEPNFRDEEAAEYFSDGN